MALSNVFILSLGHMTNLYVTGIALKGDTYHLTQRPVKFIVCLSLTSVESISVCQVVPTVQSLRQHRFNKVLGTFLRDVGPC